MSNRYLRQYDGYLKQHLAFIERMYQAGAIDKTIAQLLYDFGVRAQGGVYGQPLKDYEHIFNLTAMVRYIRRTWLRPKPAKSGPLHFWADP
jgi:hypothetical protein